MKKLRDVGEIVIDSGQIISRVIADKNRGDEVVAPQVKTIVAKTVAKGYIDDENLVINDYKTKLDDKRLTKEGDIVFKLSSPYSAALIDKTHEGLFVSSFCSIIRNVPKELDKDYLVAYLNSEECQIKLNESISGRSGMGLNIVSNGKLFDLELPIPKAKEQKEIGEYFNRTLQNKITIEKIQKLEEEKLSTMIANIKE